MRARNERAATGRALNERGLTSEVAFPALTVEVALYGALALAAFVLRFLLLGYFPLNADEARQAYASWAFVNGSPQVFSGSPLLFTGNAVLFFLFGSNDMVARLLPALFGTALVLLPALLRRELSPLGALLASALLVLSPSLVLFSRTADGAIIAVTCASAALAFAWRYVTQRRARDVYLAAVSVALALLAAREVWMVLLGVGVSLLALQKWLRPLLQAQPDAPQALGNVEAPEALTNVPARWPVRDDLVRAGVLFAAVLLGISTIMFVHLEGLAATLNLFGAWILGLKPGLSWSDPMRLLLVYEPVLLVFGMLAILELVFSRDMVERERVPAAVLAIWVVVAFVLYTVGTEKTPARVVVLLVPLALLAGGYIARWIAGLSGDLQDEPEAVPVLLTQELPVFVFACVLAAFLYFVLAEFAMRGSVLVADLLTSVFSGLRTTEGNINSIVVAVLIAAAVGAVAFLAVTTVGWARSKNIALALALVLLTTWTFRQMALVNFSPVQNPQEWLISRITSPNVRDLVNDLEDTSRWRANSSFTLTLLVDDSLGPLARWNLREFRNAGFQARPTMTPGIQALVLPPSAPVNAGNLLSQRYRLELFRAAAAPAAPNPQAAQTAQPAGNNFLRWLIFRDSGNTGFSEAVLWIPPPPVDK